MLDRVKAFFGFKKPTPATGPDVDLAAVQIADVPPLEEDMPENLQIPHSKIHEALIRTVQSIKNRLDNADKQKEERQKRHEEERAATKSQLDGLTKMCETLRDRPAGEAAASKTLAAVKAEDGSMTFRIGELDVKLDKDGCIV